MIDEERMKVGLLLLSPSFMSSYQHFPFISWQISTLAKNLSASFSARPVFVPLFCTSDHSGLCQAALCGQWF